MPPVYLVKFRQLRLPIVSAHWAIFIPYSTVRPIQGPPGPGILYHARSEWTSCFPFLSGSQFEPIPGYNLAASRNLFDYYALNDVDLSDEDVSASCRYISAHRNFNFMGRNCQEWVKEVLDNLIQRGLLDSMVSEEIKGEGYISISERCDDCARNSSSILCNKCQRRGS